MEESRFDIIALVSNDLLADQRMQRSLTTLQSAGYSCLLLGRQKHSSKPLNTAYSFSQERHLLKAQAGKLFYWQLNRAHYNRIIALRPKAILVVDLDTMPAGAMAAKKLGIPWVYDAHELFTEVPEVIRRPWIKKIWNWIARRYIPEAAACYTVGEAIAAEFEQQYNRKFEVVRNMPLRTDLQQAKKLAEKDQGEAWPVVNGIGQTSEVSPSYKAHKLDQSAPFTVIYQGALNEGRGLEQLLQVAARLHDVNWWIVGDGYLMKSLRQNAEELSLQNVFFFGEVRPESLLRLTPLADVGYALMENLGLNYYLSLSNKSSDYIHAGLPSLQMAWPEYIRINQKYGCYVLVEELTVPNILDAMKEIMRPTRYDFFETGCKAASMELFWDEVPLLNIWSSILSPGSAAG